MKRALILMAVLGLLYAAVWAGTHGTMVDLYEFPGTLTDTEGWLSHTTGYILPLCWYDTTFALDTLRDTVTTPWVYLGKKPLQYLIVKHQLAQLDTFGNVDSVDSAFLQFQACAHPVDLASLTWTYDFTGLIDVQSSPVTTVFTIADSLLLYQYPYVRYQIIYRCVADSLWYSWSANCIAKDLITKHLPIKLTEYYYPILK